MKLCYEVYVLWFFFVIKEFNFEDLGVLFIFYIIFLNLIWKFKFYKIIMLINLIVLVE